MKRRQPAGHARNVLALERARRWLRYRLIIPLFRSPHSPEHTARGIANGIFWGLTPTIGLQTIAILATWAISKRAFGKDSSLLQAMLWFWINNPITALPMYYVFYRTGVWLTGRSAAVVDYDTFSIEGLASSFNTVGVPMLVGCVPYAVIGSYISYCWAMYLVRRRRARLAARRRALYDYGTFRT